MINYDYGVVLLPVNSNDASLLQHWRNDYKVWRWCRQNDLISDMQQKRWIENQDSDRSIQMYVIAKEDGEKIGVCGFTGHDYINRTAELSIYIAPNHQKQGLGEASFRTLMNHGFKNLGLHSIWCEVYAENPVKRVVEKVGFKSYGIKPDCYFRDGKFISAEHFSILETDWAG